MKILAFDVGTKTTGVAIYQHGTVYPLTPIRHTTITDITADIADFAERYSPHIIVLGSPPRGKLKKIIAVVKRHLAKKLPNTQVISISEHLTTKYSQAQILHTSLMQNKSNLKKQLKKSKKRGEIDSHSAVIILQHALQILSNKSTKPT